MTEPRAIEGPIAPNERRLAIRARRCPRAIAALWAFEAAFAIAFAWPVAVGVGRGIGRGPAGDGVLWTPGGHDLVSLLSRQQSALAGDLALAVFVAVAAAAASLLPTATLMIAMIHAASSRQSVTVARASAGAVRAFATLAILFLAALAARAVVGGAAWLSAWLVEGWAHDRYGEARAEWLAAATFAAFAVPFVGIGLAHDLARATAVHLRAGAARAIRHGVDTIGRSPLPLAWSWAWREAASLAAVLAGSLAAARLGGHAGLALAGLAVIHQGAAFSRVALRASWIAKTLRAAAPVDSAP